MAGKSPFDSSSLNIMIKEQMKGLWLKRLSDILTVDYHKDLINFIAKTLNPDPDKRPDTSTILQHRWLFPRCNHEQNSGN